MDKFLVAGVGPGSREYLLPITEKKAEEADVLIGGLRALELFSNLEKEKLEITANLKEIRDYIRDNYQEKKILVLVSGDPGLYSLLKYLKRYFSSEKIEVIPGVSALQLGFARANLVWQDAKIISLHGSKDLDKLFRAVKEEKKVGLFTDGDFPPDEIAEYLVEQGIEGKKGFVAENLSYSSERIVDKKLGELTDKSFGSLNVMVIYDE